MDRCENLLVSIFVGCEGIGSIEEERKERGSELEARYIGLEGCSFGW